MQINLSGIGLIWLSVALAASPVLSQQARSRDVLSKVSSAAKPAPAIVVGPNVHASKTFGDKPHGEIQLAANPRDPLNLIGGSMVWLEEANTQTVVGYASFDGGKTWSASLKFDDGAYHSDPAIAFDAQGTAYFLEITLRGGFGEEPEYFTRVHRSHDGGRSWLAPVVMPMLDRHYIVVDDNHGKHHGSVYINGLSVGAVRVQKSPNRGAEFDTSVAAARSPSDRRYAGIARLTVLSDSTLVIPFADTELPMPDVEGSPGRSNAALRVIMSEDGGKTFSEPVTIARTAIGHMLTSNAHHFAFAADRSAGPFKDRLYVAWSDAHSGGGQFSVKKSGGSNILFSYSTDKGKSWSKPILVNDDRLPSNLLDAPVHFQPVIAVNKDGVVGLMYYDRRDSANNLDWTVRFAASLDGGETFLPTVQVAEVPNRYGNFTRLALGVRGYGGGHTPPNKNFRGGPLKFDVAISQFNIGGGHTAGLDAGANGVFHPFWIDNRTGVSQVWTAPVTVNRKSKRNGDPELAELQDVSEKIVLRFTSPVYDARTGQISVDVELQNISTETITLPIKLRVVILTSGSGGRITITHADNGLTGTGAVFDLASVLIDQKLKPNQKSKLKRLEFHVADVPPLTGAGVRSRGWGALELIHLEARVLAATDERK